MLTSPCSCRYMQLIKQAAGTPASTNSLPASQLLQQESASAARQKVHSSLGFTPAAAKKHGASAGAAGASRPATASPVANNSSSSNSGNSASWQYSSTMRAAAAGKGISGQGSALMGACAPSLQRQHFPQQQQHHHRQQQQLVPASQPSAAAQAAAAAASPSA